MDNPAGCPPSHRLDGQRQERRARDRAELTAAALLLLAALAGVAAIVVYIVTDDTQLLGISFGVAFLGVAGAMIVAGLRLYPAQKVVEERPVAADEVAEAEVEEKVEDAVGGISRRKLLAGAAGAAGAAIGGALIVPLGSLGPFELGESFDELPWQDGVRLVDEAGRPLEAESVEEGAFYTAFPEGAGREQLGSPLVVVRLAELDLPDGREDCARGDRRLLEDLHPRGLRGRALPRAALPGRAPEAGARLPVPLLDLRRATGGTVLFGPAGRPLPQLPLEIDGDGNLSRRGGFAAGRPVLVGGAQEA